MYEGLVEILEKSVVKNGTKPLSNVWLLNILKASQRGTTKNTELTEPEGGRYPTDLELLNVLEKMDFFEWHLGMRSLYHQATCVDFERVGKKVKLAGDDWVTWFDESEVHPRLSCDVFCMRMLREVLRRAPGARLRSTHSGGYELMWGVHYISSSLCLGRALGRFLLLLDELA